MDCSRCSLSRCRHDLLKWTRINPATLMLPYHSLLGTFDVHASIPSCRRWGHISSPDQPLPAAHSHPQSKRGTQLHPAACCPQPPTVKEGNPTTPSCLLPTAADSQRGEPNYTQLPAAHSAPQSKRGTQLHPAACCPQRPTVNKGHRTTPSCLLPTAPQWRDTRSHLHTPATPKCRPESLASTVTLFAA
ncbi:hypothetical protein COO60DRAFT_1195280 [Scenedesmus sp. NREL 46B-D3]|nr:hypothetical protein COO60DRAFT_1195280 [Scenedesmus sp. NREL 46B-D3]